MLNSPHTCNANVAKPLDQNKGVQSGVQKNQTCQAAGRSEMQQLTDSFRMGETLPKVVIGKEVADNLPTIIVCEKFKKSCECTEPNLQNLPSCIRETVEKETKLKKQRALNLLLYKTKRLSDQIQNARYMNCQLNEQMVELIHQQNSCPYTCDKPCPPASTCPATPCPPVTVCPALSKPEPCPALLKPSPCPPMPKCPAISTSCTCECTGPCNGLNTDEIAKLLGRLETIMQSCDNALESKKCNENVKKMLHSCEGPCNLLKQQLECQGPCNASVTLDCSGPCSSTPNKLKDCEGPCNIKGMKDKIASLANVPATCDKLKALLTDCYFNKEDSPRRYTSFNFKEKPNICGAQVPKCPALTITPTCPPTHSTCPPISNKSVSEEVDQIEARAGKLIKDLERFREERESLQAKKRFLECLMNTPCNKLPCPPPQPPPKPPCSPVPQVCPASQSAQRTKNKCLCK